MLSLLKKVVPILLVLVLACPPVADALTQNETFQLSGFGGYTIAPAGFDGSIIGGTLAPGTFVIDIDASTWPVDNPATPQNERWGYVFGHYFVYDNTPGAASWTMHLPPLPEQTPVVTWSFYHNGDKIGGIMMSLIITISDKDNDGVLDPVELEIQAVSGNLVCHIEQSTGIYEGLCGGGSLNGTMEGFDNSQPYVLTISGGNLLLRDFGCQVATENTTWGAIKEIYSE